MGRSFGGVVPDLKADIIFGINMATAIATTRKIVTPVKTLFLR